jgi:hypothetical protein
MVETSQTRKQGVFRYFTMDNQRFEGVNMHRSRVGKFVLRVMLLVASLLLLQSCSWTGSDHVSWVFTTLDAHGGDRFDWKGGHREIELKAGSADVGVVATKLEPADLWGLRQGDALLRVDDKPVHTVRALLADLQGLHGADVGVWVKRNGMEMKLNLRGSDYRPVLPPSITPDTSMTSGNSGSSLAVSVDAH